MRCPKGVKLTPEARRSWAKPAVAAAAAEARLGPGKAPLVLPPLWSAATEPLPLQAGGMSVLACFLRVF